MARSGVDPWAWPVRPIEMPAGGAGGLIISGRCYLVGWSLLNGSTSPGTAAPTDGTTASGVLLDTIQLAASTAARANYNNPGLFCEIGLYVVVTGITVTGTLYVRFEKPHEHVGGQNVDRWRNDQGEHGNAAAALRSQHPGAYSDWQSGN